MIDHLRGLELAALGPAFAIDPVEAAELDAHLASCAMCSRDVAALRSDLGNMARIDAPRNERLRERVRAAAYPGDPTGRSWPIATIAAMGLLAVALLGATLGAGAYLSQRNNPLTQVDPNDPPVLVQLTNKRIQWTTGVVSLGADSVAIDANGTTVHAETEPMQVHSDPGSLTYWTLEVAWLEAGLEQRINLYFKADATSWWVDEVRVYDGVAPRPDWASFPREQRFRTALGSPFIGDVDLAGLGRAGAVHLTMKGVVLAVTPQQSFVSPPGGGVALANDPFDPGGPLRCTGILQLHPTDADQLLRDQGYRLSWRWEYSTGPNTGFGEIRLEAPAVGFISHTAVGSNGELIIFVEDPTRPSSPAATLPPDCPPSSPS